MRIVLSCEGGVVPRTKKPCRAANCAIHGWEKLFALAFEPPVCLLLNVRTFSTPRNHLSVCIGVPPLERRPNGAVAAPAREAAFARRWPTPPTTPRSLFLAAAAAACASPLAWAERGGG
jgi:hypothetical protein